MKCPNCNYEIRNRKTLQTELESLLNELKIILNNPSFSIIEDESRVKDLARRISQNREELEFLRK